MSCPHSRQIKKGVSSTVSKHFRSQEKATVSISNAVPCCDRSDMAGTFPAQRKMKRLKTYKERSQIRDGQKLRQRHHSKAKGHSHGHSHGQSQFQTAVAKIFPHLKPCIITERRLVGHQGLFNHEVKSFDIERLLTKSKKGTRSDTRGIQNSKHKSSDSQVLMSPSNVGDSDGGIDCAASPENSIQHRASLHTANAGSIPQSAACGQALQRNHDALLKHVGKSLTSTQSDESPECCAKGEDSGASLIRKDCMALCSSESDPDPCCPSRTSAVSNSTMKSRANTAVPEVSRTFKVKEQCSQQALKPQPAIPLDLTPGSHPSIGDGSLTSDGTQRELLRADSKEVSRQQQVSMVAACLCQSLKMPRRKHLLDETRGVLLQALRERHGAQIQENMLNLQRHLFEQGQNNRGHISLGKTPALDDQCIGTGQDCMEQPHLDSQRKPYCNRRRKQPCPQRRSPLPLAFTPQHSSERAAPWSLKLGAEEEAIKPPLKTPSSLLAMDIQHTFTSSPCSSNWGLQQNQIFGESNVLFDQKGIKFQAQGDHLEWRLNSSFLCQSKHFEDSFSKNCSVASDIHMKDKNAIFFPENPQIHHHSSVIHSQPSASNINRFNRDLMSFYPASELLEIGMSPLLPSPEHWSYPRMRLY